MYVELLPCKCLCITGILAAVFNSLAFKKFASPGSSTHQVSFLRATFSIVDVPLVAVAEYMDVSLPRARPTPQKNQIKLT